MVRKNDDKIRILSGDDMSAGNYIGYFAYLIEQGKMTEEEASKKLKELHKIDMMHDEFDREFFKNCKAYIHSGSVLTKEQTEVIYELAKEPIEIDEETLDKFNSIGCTSFQVSIEDWKRLEYTDEEAKELMEASYIYK